MLMKLAPECFHSDKKCILYVFELHVCQQRKCTYNNHMDGECYIIALCGVDLLTGVWEAGSNCFLCVLASLFNVS